ncbi:constitutive coactivator of peroxisome proliferator-activated receptor gamma isoform X2 [Anguilla anguilla]|uniref:constitutive coactivator of peroxisome proliferator-activated receptor gamma isoform X2 n=1 Tax=Anguilla anguilla TaxID=7936 RepID=UPI0015A7E4DF|nr:constitutive coactivator of peroxisome proliferator-activated receptor gamma isoform X2 [Anguilla anguilla]
MGVKGLQGFVENAVPGACVQVDLREMAEQHRRAKPGHVPTLAVDGMACLRLWYSCQAWVHGGQWREYLHLLEEFVASFTAAGIRLVFFFDGVVDDDKRKEWVRRRLRVNKDVARVFQHIKLHGQQPGRDLLCLPSGLATFSTFALKSLGQETWSTTREADYEIASYALQNDCMGILSQDSDFLIFDTAPYLSVSRLRLDRLCTMQLCRDTLCRTLGLHPGDLPLLACVLGNDTVPEQRLQCLRSKCMAEYRSRLSQTPNHGKVFAVAEFISSNRPSSGEAEGIVRLPLSDIDRVLLEEGVRKYLLPGQRSPWVNSDSPSPPLVCEMERFSSADIMQAAKEKHIRAECFIVYNVLYDGVVECSNTLEDEEETDLPPQALLYRPARERLYGLLLPTPAGSSPAPAVKEWFVFPGNQLKEPDLVSPVPLGQPVKWHTLPLRRKPRFERPVVWRRCDRDGAPCDRIPRHLQPAGLRRGPAAAGYAPYGRGPPPHLHLTAGRSCASSRSDVFTPVANRRRIIQCVSRKSYQIYIYTGIKSSECHQTESLAWRQAGFLEEFAVCTCINYILCSILSPVCSY